MILSSVKVAAFLAAAIATGAMLAVLVTAAGRGIAGDSPSSDPSVVAVASFAPASALATSSPEPTASTAPSARSTSSPSPSAVLTPMPSVDPVDAGLPAGCFSDGLLSEGESVEPIVAGDLLRRLPVPSQLWSEPVAYVGSSANRLFVTAFAACTGADPATIRWGGVNGGLTSGTFPQAIQIDGFTGPELAQVFIDGYLHPEQRAALEVGQHAGWTYRYLDKLIAITASPDTLYWYWVWPCCYEGPLFADHTFVDVIHEYIDLTNDVPTDWP